MKHSWDIQTLQKKYEDKCKYLEQDQQTKREDNVKAMERELKNKLKDERNKVRQKGIVIFTVYWLL